MNRGGDGNRRPTKFAIAERYRSIGFFGDISDEEFNDLFWRADGADDPAAEAARPAHEGDQNALLRVLAQSPRLFWRSGYETPVDEEGGYVELLDRLAAITGGLLALYDVEDTAEAGSGRLVRFSIAGKRYTFGPAMADRFDSRICNMLNRALADCGVDGRFVRIGYGRFPPRPERTVFDPIGFFTEAEREDLSSLRLVHLNWGGPEYTTSELIGLLDELDATLLAGQSETKRAATREAVLRRPVDAAYGLLEDLGVAYGFDTECIDAPASNYPELIRDILPLTHGRLLVDNVTAVPSDDRKHVDLTITFGADSRSLQLNWDGSDWIDQRFATLLNAVAEAQGIDHRFHQLRTFGQDMTLVFLSTDQFERLERHPLVDFH